MIALTSFQGSGNTWTRHLIEQMTSIYTGSIYHDQSLIKGGFLGEGRADGTVSVVKSHFLLSREKWNTIEGMVFIERNPFDAFRSEFNRHKF